MAADEDNGGGRTDRLWRVEERQRDTIARLERLQTRLDENFQRREAYEWRAEQTMAALERRLPADYWVEINGVLVPFGKHICTGSLPRCSTCPVLDMCRQVGVTAHR